MVASNISTIYIERKLITEIVRTWLIFEILGDIYDIKIIYFRSEKRSIECSSDSSSYKSFCFVFERIDDLCQNRLI